MYSSINTIITSFSRKEYLCMKTVHYNVSGLASRKSKAKVLNALDKIKGVQEVAVDLSRGTIEVEFNEPATPDAIENCIEHTGYIITK